MGGGLYVTLSRYHQTYDFLCAVSLPCDVTRSKVAAAKHKLPVLAIDRNASKSVSLANRRRCQRSLRSRSERGVLLVLPQSASVLGLSPDMNKLTMPSATCAAVRLPVGENQTGIPLTAPGMIKVASFGSTSAILGPIILRKARFSQDLRIPSNRCVSRNWIVSSYL